MKHERVQRWGIGLVGTVLLVSLGLLYGTATPILAAVVPLSFVLYGELSRLSPAASVSVSRSFDERYPAPGAAVGVELVVENTGTSTLTDLRVVDQVPAELAVTAGSPRAALSLRPGDRETIEYEIVTKRGDYRFEDPLVRLRTLSGTDVATGSVPAAGDDVLTCRSAVTDPPREGATIARAGTQPTTAGGSGIEFHSTRAYHPSDPLRRIDWRGFAKTGELATIDYRQERAIRTVVVIDARDPGRVTPVPGHPTGAELAAYAGSQLYEAITDEGMVATLTAVGVDRATYDGRLGPDGLPWVRSRRDPGADRAGTLVLRAVHEAVAREIGERTLADEDGQAAAGQEAIDALLSRLPGTAQVVLVSPVLDGWPVALAERLAIHDYPLVVVSPDVTGEGTRGRTLASVERGTRLSDLELAGASTLDWERDEPLGVALQESMRRLV